MTVTVRPATPDDEPDVVAFTRDTWPDRGGDYLPRVFADWVASDDEAQRTFVAEEDGRAVGLVQGLLLTEREAWLQGMRVAPAVRGRGVSARLHDAAAGWARERGATVARVMVFSWNAPALAASRAAGLEPATAFRWVHPAPDPDAAPGLAVVADPDAAWTYWQRSAARDHLRGLALAAEESWALRELTRGTLARAAAETHLAVVRDGGTRGVAFRVRDYDREVEDGESSGGDSEAVASSGRRSDGTRRTSSGQRFDGGEPDRWAEYGVAAWADPAAGEALLAAVARDAASVGADRARVLVPETAGAVSDAALAGAEVAGEPTYVLEADLTRLD